MIVLKKIKACSRTLLRSTFVTGFYFLSGLCYSQQHYQSLSGARESGMANSSVSLSSVWSVYHNPAGLACLPKASLGINYLNCFLLNELSTSSFSMNLPVIGGGFGMGFSYFGTSRYNEQRYVLGYAHSLGEKIELGVQGNYFQIHLPENYENTIALSGDIGALLHPIEELSIGIKASNLWNSKFKNYAYEKLPVSCTTGINWKEEVFLLSAQIEMDNLGNTELSSGTEICLAECFIIRLGISTKESMSYTFGLGFLKERLQCDIAFLRHPSLGISSSLSIVYNLKNRK